MAVVIEFRETEQFASTYLEVFGHPYTSKLREEADQASKHAAEEAKKEASEINQSVEEGESSVDNDKLKLNMARPPLKSGVENVEL